MHKKKRHPKPERPTGGGYNTGGWWAGYMFPDGWTAQSNLSGDQFGDTTGGAAPVGSDGSTGSV